MDEVQNFYKSLTNKEMNKEKDKIGCAFHSLASLDKIGCAQE